MFQHHHSITGSVVTVLTVGVILNGVIKLCPVFASATGETELQHENVIEGAEVPYYDELENAVAKLVDFEQAGERVPSLEELTHKSSTPVRILTGAYHGLVYNQINSYLVDSVPDKDIANNMEAAYKWLNGLQSSYNPLDWSLVAALRQFTSLTEVLGPKKCSRFSYATLFKNDQAIGGKTRMRREKLPLLRRVDHIIHHYGLAHTLACHFEYPKKYQELHERMNSTALYYVESFMGQICVLSDLEKKKPKPALGFEDELHLAAGKQRGVYSILQAGPTVGKLARRSLANFAAQDPNSKYLGKVMDEKTTKFKIDRKGIHNLVDKYFLEPCLYYVEHLGPDVFVPMRYDTRLLDKSDRYDPSDTTLSNFLAASNYFSLCSTLIQRDDREYLVNKIAEAIAS